MLGVRPSQESSGASHCWQPSLGPLLQPNLCFSCQLLQLAAELTAHIGPRPGVGVHVKVVSAAAGIPAQIAGGIGLCYGPVQHLAIAAILPPACQM
jgi:hypothetical protein